MTKAGGGHLSVAQSLQDMLKDRYQVEIINTYKDIIHSNNEDNYNKILKYNLSSLYWPVFVKLFRLQLWLFKNSYINRFRQYFATHKFDLVISVVPFLNEMISAAINTKFIILPTDLSNPFPTYWFAKADLIITCTTRLYQQAKDCGYTNIESIPSLPLRQKFYQPTTAVTNNTTPHHPDTAQNSYSEKTRLPNRKKVLITYGKTPPNRLYSTIYALSILGNINLSVICGENSYLFNKVNALSNVKAYGFVDNINEIIDNNDIIITKPGPTTIFEILARGKYLLIEDNTKTMLHEKYNIHFVIDNKLGQAFANITELKHKMLNLGIVNNQTYQFSKPNEKIRQIIFEALLD